MVKSFKSNFYFWPKVQFELNICNCFKCLGSLLTLFLFSFISRVYQGRGGDLEDFYILVVILFCVSFHLLKNDIVIEPFIYALN